jgi:hypothetical protein
VQRRLSPDHSHRDQSFASIFAIPEGMLNPDGHNVEVVNHNR